MTSRIGRPLMRGGLVAGGRTSEARRGAAPVPAPAGTPAGMPAGAWLGALEHVPRSPFAGVVWGPTLAGFLLYLLVITSYRLPVGDVAIVAALGGTFMLRGGVRFPSYLRWFVAFTVWVFAAATQSRYPDWVVEPRMLTLKLVLIVYVAANAIRTRAEARLFMVFFLGCFALFPLRGAMFNYFLYDNAVQGRAIWNLLYSNPNDLGAMALLQLSMAVALLATEPKGWVRRAAILGIFMLPMLILLTQSRGVFLGLLVFLAITVGGQRNRLKLLFRLAVVVVALAMVAPASVWERLGTLKKATSAENIEHVDGADGSARQRQEIWRVAFRMIEEHPITGVGIGAYKPNHEVIAERAEFNPTARGKRDTHSLYFNVLAETGYPGLFLYLGMLATVLVATERARRRCRRLLPKTAQQLLLLEAGLIGFLAASTFGSLPYLPHLLLHLVLLHSLSTMSQKELAAMSGARAA